MKSAKPGSRHFRSIAAVGIIFLLLLLAGPAVFYVLPPPSPRAGTGANPRALRVEFRLASYFHTGRWRADARTFVGMLKYLATPESTPLTNQPSVKA
ncbi:MAG TPA: hypothetical protein VG167_04065 [Verrucomicrobiae bacterium]|nr:hypothetical protein [Verrucomicrobiae bacterium]